MMDSVVALLKKLSIALKECGYEEICLRPQQVKCFEYLVLGFDLIAVLPTGYGKSLIFHLLPDLLKYEGCDQNMVIVISPLNSIIEDQLNHLKNKNIPAAVLQVGAHRQ